MAEKKKKKSAKGKGKKLTPRKKAPSKAPKKISPAPVQDRPGQAVAAAIMDLMKGMDVQSLKQLLQQAQAIKSAAQTPPAAPAKPAAAAVKPGPGNKYTIDVKESEDGSYYILVINNARNFFTLEEMRKIVRLCHDAPDEREACRRLHGWFQERRKDVLIDTKITGPGDPAILTMYRFLKGRYRVKGGK